MHIGAVRYQKRKVAHSLFLQGLVEVSFDEGRWDLINWRDLPHHRYMQPDSAMFDKHMGPSWILRLPMADGKFLLIPCVEFFTKFYGRSEALRRVLLTYRYDEREKINDAFYQASLKDFENTQGAWLICLGKYMEVGDAKFLAHLQRDEYTRKQTKALHSHIHTSFANGDEPHMRATPWYQGGVQIRASGVWLNDSMFLALNVHGATDPEGPEIVIVRRKMVLTEGNPHTTPEWTMKHRRAVNATTEKPSEQMQDSPPERDAAIVRFKNPQWEVIGNPRRVTRKNVIREAEGLARHLPKKDTDPSRASAGAPYGNDGGISQACIVTLDKVPSKGVLRDMWDAFCHIAKEEPDFIQSVGYYVSGGGFWSGDQPVLVSFPPVDQSRHKTKEAGVLNWPYLDLKTYSFRGALVIKVMAQGQAIYVFESQRRISRPKADGPEQPEPKEEPYKGLAFTLDEEDDLEAAVTTLLDMLPITKGKFEPILWRFQGVYHPFVHKPWEVCDVPGKRLAKKIVDDVLREADALCSSADGTIGQ